MILSAVSLWKKFDVSNPLRASEYNAWTDKAADMYFSYVTYSGHKTADGDVRVFARFGKPASPSAGKIPAILLLPDAGVGLDEELLYYFIDKGYAVLMPDYCGETEKEQKDDEPHTVYPPSLTYANYATRSGFDHMPSTADNTCWFEWIYVALYSVQYLKEREDISSIGVVGIRTGGEIAWKVMLSPDVACGVPINAAGWHSYREGKFSETAENNMSDERHAYIAGIESQSYAPFVKCPVLMLCAFRDEDFDCDRAYDTYLRMGVQDGSAIVYSQNSGSCIGPNALSDMDLFLERHLKGREIYIPKPLNVTLREDGDDLYAEAECDKDGILEEAGICFAESGERTKSIFREWQCVARVDGKNVTNGKISCLLPRFQGAAMSFVYAYAKYINGFQVSSKILCKKFPDYSHDAVKSRVIYSGKDLEGISVANYEDYSAADIFLERDAVPKLAEGYGKIKGAYSVGGIMTYKISSPRYVPDENAMLEFDVYAWKNAALKVAVDVDEGNRTKRYSCMVSVASGGKWKRIILTANELKSDETGAPLTGFTLGQSLIFDCDDEDTEYAVTNILWL